MGRNLKGQEVKVVRTISTQLTIWNTFKKWCTKNHKSMSEVIESLMLRIMDEDRDILSLTNEADELRSKIQLSNYRIQREKSEMETHETDLNLLEDRISVVMIEEKDRVKTALEKFKELKDENNAKI
jgi:hypothetical protein